MGLLAERWYPLVCGVAAGFLWFRFGPAFPTDNNAFLSASLTLGSIITGFMATAKTILMGLQGTEVMRDLRRSTYIEVLVSYLSAAIFSAFGFCIVTLMGFFLDGSRAFASAWFALAVFAALAFIRVVLILLRILKFADRDARKAVD